MVAPFLSVWHLIAGEKAIDSEYRTSFSVLLNQASFPAKRLRALRRLTAMK